MKSPLTLTYVRPLVGLAVALGLWAGAGRAPADLIIKANTTVGLAFPASWETLPGELNPRPPGPEDIADWSASISAPARTLSLGGIDVEWGGIRVQTIGGELNITNLAGEQLYGTNRTIYLGSYGILMTNAGNTVILSNNLALNVSQTWQLRNNKTLFLRGNLSGTNPAMLWALDHAGVTFISGSNSELQGAQFTVSSTNVHENGAAYAGFPNIVILQSSNALGQIPKATLIAGGTGTARNDGTRFGLFTNVSITNITLEMMPAVTNGDQRITLYTWSGNAPAANQAGVSGWYGPIVISDGEYPANVQFSSGDSLAHTLVIGGPVVKSNEFTGILRFRNSGTNVLSAAARVSIGTNDVYVTDGGKLMIYSASNVWGQTIIEGAAARAAHVRVYTNFALPTNTFLVMGAGANVVTLDLNGTTQSIGGLRRGTTVALGPTDFRKTNCVISSSSSTADSALVFRGNPLQASMYSGVLYDYIPEWGGSKKLSLIVESGSLTLAPTQQTNKISGAVAVRGGTLATSTFIQGGADYSVAPGAHLAVNVGAAGDFLGCRTLKLSNCVMTVNLGVYGNPQNPYGPVFVFPDSMETRGNVTINVRGFGLTAGQFPLIYRWVPLIDGDGTNAFKLGTLPPGVISASLVNNPNNQQLDLKITTASRLIGWYGGYGTDWDIASTYNWHSVSNDPLYGLVDAWTEMQYLNSVSGSYVGDTVLFNYINQQPTNEINLTTAVRPAFVWFDLERTNDGVNWDGRGSVWKLDSDNGLGSIGGTNTQMLITKNPGIVIIGTSNSYGGGTILSNGTLVVNHNNALGKGPLYVGGYASDGISAAEVCIAADGSTNDTPRNLTNSVFMEPMVGGVGLYFGNDATADTYRNGVAGPRGRPITFWGNWDLGFGLRLITNRCDVTVVGNLGSLYLTNSGAINKFGQGTLRLKGTNWFTGGAFEVREGTVVFDGGVTTNFNDTIRPGCLVPITNNFARCVVTNGGWVVIRGLGANLRTGHGDPNGQPVNPDTGARMTKLTNYWEIAGSVRFPDANADAGAAHIGHQGRIGVITLWPNGDLAVRRVHIHNINTAPEYAEFNFRGGTLRAVGSRTDFFQGLTNAFVWAGTAQNYGTNIPYSFSTIDTGTNAIQIAQSLYFPTNSLNGQPGVSGGIIKKATGYVFDGNVRGTNGMLTLAGTNNTFSGAIVVAEGKLNVGGNLRASPPTYNTIVISNDAILEVVPDRGIMTNYTKTMTNANLVCGKTGYSGPPITNHLVLAFGNYVNTNLLPSYAPIRVATQWQIPASNHLKIHITGSRLRAGMIPLLSFASKSVGTQAGYSIGSVPSSFASYSLLESNSCLYLKLDLVAPLIWTGTSTNAEGDYAWDMNVSPKTTNWTRLGIPYGFEAEDAVQFDDTAAGTTRVEIVETVVPSGVVFSNNAKDYLLAGAGGIGGLQGLEKQGSGKVTLATANSYASDTIISNGTLQTAVVGAIPSGGGKSNVFIWGSGKLDANANVVMNGLQGNGTITDSSPVRDANVTAGANNQEVIWSGTLSGERLRFIKTGNGLGILSGTNTHGNQLQIRQTLTGKTLIQSPYIFGYGTFNFVNSWIMVSPTNSPMVITNFSLWSGSLSLGDKTNNGRLEFNGNVNLDNGSRFLDIESDVVIRGVVSNGRFIKTGPTNVINTVSGSEYDTNSWGYPRYKVTTLTLSGGGTRMAQGGISAVRRGRLVLDGGTFSLGDNRLTPDSWDTNGAVWLVVTNPAVVVQGSSHLYIGVDGIRQANTNVVLGENFETDVWQAPGFATNSAPTNTLDLAGRWELGGTRSLIYGWETCVTNYLTNLNEIPPVTTNIVTTALNAYGVVNLWTTNGELVCYRVGRFTTNSITKAELNFRGGRLTATQTNYHYLETLDSCRIWEGAVFNSGSYAIGVDQPLLAGPSGGGGLVKVGSGVLELYRANSYTGPTEARQGTLVMNTLHTGGGNIIVSNRARLDVVVGYADRTLECSNLWLGSTLATGSVTNGFKFGPNATTAFPVIQVSGALMTTGMVYVYIEADAGLLTPGVYPLIAYGSIGGNQPGGAAAFVLRGLPPGVAATLVHNAGAKKLELHVSGASSGLVWVGGSGGSDDWDIGTTANWSGGVDGKYYEYGAPPTNGDHVVFDDSASINNTVDIVADVQPATLTMVNNDLLYTFKSTTGNSITGGVSLVKQGTNVLVIENNNYYTGGTYIENRGRIRVGSDHALGNGAVIIKGAGLAAAGTDPRTVTNRVVFTFDEFDGGITNFLGGLTNYLGGYTNNGVLTLAGPIDFDNGTRNIAFLSDVIITGQLGNNSGSFNKFYVTNPFVAGSESNWTTTVTVSTNGKARLNGTVVIFDGQFIVDAGRVTNSAEIRLDATLTNGYVRMAITNGGQVWLAWDGNPHVGYDQRSIDNGTNILDVAGLYRLSGASTGNGRLILGRTGTRGILNLYPGGDMYINGIENSDAGPRATNAIVNIYGGTMRVHNVANGSFMQGIDELVGGVHKGGVFLHGPEPFTFDTRGYNTTIAEKLLDGSPGGQKLWKIGSGALSLRGSNVWGGDIEVLSGQLTLNTANGWTNDPALNYQYGGNNNVTMSNNTTLRVDIHVPGATLRLASLTLGNRGDGNVNQTFNLGSVASVTQAVVTVGTLYSTGTVSVTILSTNLSLQPTNYPLMKYGALDGVGFPAFQLVSLPMGVLGTLYHDVPNQIIGLAVSAAANSVVWSADYNNDWDIGITTNWNYAVHTYDETLVGTNLLADSAWFDDSIFLIRATNATLTTALNPMGVSVNSGGYDYVFTGPGSLNGSMVLRKAAVGALTITNANTYSNGTVILQNGSMRVGNDYALGSGRVTMSSTATLSSDGTAPRTITNEFLIRGAVVLGNLTNNGTLTFTGPWNFNGGEQSLTISNDVVFTGPLENGRFYKQGTGLLTIKSTNVLWNGTMECRYGTVLFDGASVTNNGDIRPDCQYYWPAEARIIVTNGSYIEFIGNNHVRVGTDGNYTATNYFDCAGMIRYAAVGGNNQIIIGRRAPGIFNLWPGGDVEANYVRSSDITNLAYGLSESKYSEFNFRGGVLRAMQSRANFMDSLSNCFVYPVGAFIDTRTFNITVTQSLLNASSVVAPPYGGLTKTGSGTLTMMGTNTYRGDTWLNEGGLLFGTGNRNTGGIRASNGTTLGWVLHTTNGTLARMNLTNLYLGTVSTNLGGVMTNVFNLGTNGQNGSWNNAIVYATNLYVTGAVYVNFSGTPVVTNYPLIQYVNYYGEGGTPATSPLVWRLDTLPPGIAATVTNDTVRKQVRLLVTFVANNLTWSGNSSDVWTSNNVSLINWLDPLGAGAYYKEGVFGDYTTFGDTVLNGRSNINVAASLQPSTVTVAGNEVDYAFGGSGKLVGVTRLTKSGAGNLTISNANEYLGGSTLAAGVTRLAHDTALGWGPVTLSGGALQSATTNDLTLTNSFTLTAGATLGDATNNGKLTLTGPVNLNNGTRDLLLQSDVVMSGAQTNGRINLDGVTLYDEETGDPAGYTTGTLTLRSNQVWWNNVSEIRQGVLLIDGARVTNTVETRIDANRTNGWAQIIVTNGGSLITSNAASSAYMRIGYDGFTVFFEEDEEGNWIGSETIEGAPTNQFDIAGEVRFVGPLTSPRGRLIYGSQTELNGYGIVNLWSNGLLEVRSVVQDDTATNFQSFFNFRGGTLVARTNAETGFLVVSNATLFETSVIEIGSNLTCYIQSGIGNGGAGGELIKKGWGTLRMNGVNAYPGTTRVVEGGLGGVGEFAGSVVCSPGTRLTPGLSGAIGSMTVHGALTLGSGGTAAMQVTKDGGVANDRVAGLSSVTYAGTLEITRVGTNALADGDTFQLFSAVGYLGEFSSITPFQPDNNSKLFWDPRGLKTTGTIMVRQGADFEIVNGKLRVSWPSIDGRWIQIQTNAITVGISTNWVDVPGSGSTNEVFFDINYAIAPTVFMRICYP